MIVRIWRTGVDETRARDYREFALQRSLPMFRSQPGFAGVLFAARPDQRAVITLWADRAAIQALDRSDCYQETVAAIEAEGFLTGKAEVELFDLEGGLIEHGSALFRCDMTPPLRSRAEAENRRDEQP